MKISVVSNRLSQTKSSASSLSKSRKGFKLAKNMTKSIDRLYNHDDWNQKWEDTDISNEYMLNLQFPSFSLARSTLFGDKNTASTTETLHYSRTRKDSESEGKSVGSRRGRGLLLSKQKM